MSLKFIFDIIDARIKQLDNAIGSPYDTYEDYAKREGKIEELEDLRDTLLEFIKNAKELNGRN